MRNRYTAENVWYTASCCLWATFIAFLVGWTFRLTGLQTGFTYFCFNAFIDWWTIFAITRVYVPYLTRPMAIVLVGAILLNVWGWLDYRNTGYAVWFDSAMDIVAALQILVFLCADIGLRMGINSASILNWLRSLIGRSDK